MAFWLLLVSAPALGEAWQPTTSGPMASLTAPLTPPQHLTLQPLALTTFTRGAHDASGRLVTAPPEASFIAQLFAELGISDWLAAGVQPQTLTNATDAFSFGDTLAFARVAWRGAEEAPHPAATWILQGSLPTGDVASGAGNGAWIGTTGTSFTFYARPFVFHTDVLLSLPIPDEAGRRLRPTASWTAAVEIPAIFVDNRAALLLELAGRHQGSELDATFYPDAEPPEQEVLIGVGIELIMSDSLQALVGWQRTLIGRNVAAIDTVVVTLVPLLAPRS